MCFRRSREVASSTKTMRRNTRVVLDGMEGGRAGGVVYASTMPPFAGMLGDAEIVDIIDYERSSWGNHGNPVTAAQVAAERASPK